MSQTYNRISTNDDDANYDQNEAASRLQPVEICTTDGLMPSSTASATCVFTWSDPWLPSLMITVLLSTPTLCALMYQLYDVLGRTYVLVPFAAHGVFSLTAALVGLRINYKRNGSTPCSSSWFTHSFKSVAYLMNQVVFGVLYPKLVSALVDDLWTEYDGSSIVENAFVALRINYKRNGNSPRSSSWFTRSFKSVACLVDLVFFGVLYPKVASTLVDDLWTECDGSTVVEYTQEKKRMHQIRTLSLAIFAGRLGLAVVAWTSRILENEFSRLQQPSQRTTAAWCCGCCSDRQQRYLRGVVKWVVRILWIVALALLGIGLKSAQKHFFAREPPAIDPAVLSSKCDLLDETECLLPFPSFHYLERNKSSVTGWQVHIPPHVLPPKRDGSLVDSTVLNELDGFSTMGPMLFYLEGMKEAHDAQKVQHDGSDRPSAGGASSSPLHPRLMGPGHVAESVTERSITLLLDVEATALVPHTAEIDYLDPERPMVLVFPGRPLHHNRHYALAVAGARNGRENLELHAPTSGLYSIMDEESVDPVRKERFENVLFPALRQAAPWVGILEDRPRSTPLQLIFDFHTVSAESQLGPARAARDIAMEMVEQPSWHWEDRVRLHRIDEYDCGVEDQTNFYARTIHASLDVPWFLHKFGPGHRGAVMDENVIQELVPARIGSANFVLHVPCSVKAFALNGGRSSASNKNSTGVLAKPIRTVLQYGHSLFATRADSTLPFVQQQAHQEGYLVMAMDWRGMSAYDLTMFARVMLEKPSLFRAVRDNLIQGFVNNIVLQDFARRALFYGNFDWLSFETEEGEKAPLPIAAEGTNPLSFAFYGVSQGGILGAGYVSLAGETGLIDRATLSVPGTPFALVMTRSSAFRDFDQLMLLNFYHNRHVRMVLACVQMLWDSTEGSGFLALPQTEFRPPILMQTGLGDATVSTHAAEVLARGLDAALLPLHVRDVYGLSIYDGSPSAVLTELRYKEDVANLPVENTFGPWNQVHTCVQYDDSMIRQSSAFFNDGTFLDICQEDERHCVRQRANCFAR